MSKKAPDLWQILKENAPESITWNHYDLANNTEVDNPDVWKKFLMQQDVIDWVKEEQAIMQKYELAKLSTDVANSRSVGQAQLISAMEKVNANNSLNTKHGPIFIYTYVPLNKQQAQASNVCEAEYDVFLKATEEDVSEGGDVNDLPKFTFDD